MKKVLSHVEFKVGTEQNYPMVGRADVGKPYQNPITATALRLCSGVTSK